MPWTAASGPRAGCWCADRRRLQRGDPIPSDRPLANRVRRALSPAFGARENAAEALDEIVDTAADVAVHPSDLALLNGHPSGPSPRRAGGRLGTALWEIFPAHVALLDRDGVLVSVNQAWRKFSLENGGSPAAGLGCNYLEVCEAAAADGDLEATEAAALVLAALRGDSKDSRVRYECGDRWFSMQAIPIPGRHSGALVVHSDITGETKDVDGWRHRALHDSLTGLPNRALLEDRLAHAVAGAARDPQSVAVLFVDLDSFKAINDTYGHAAGDRVLQEAAARMSTSVRSGDTIGRWGGDEFLVIAERLDSSETADDLVARVARSLEDPIDFGTGVVSVGLTVGVAQLDAGQPADALIDAADQALQALRRTRNRGVVPVPR